MAMKGIAEIVSPSTDSSVVYSLGIYSLKRIRIEKITPLTAKPSKRVNLENAYALAALFSPTELPTTTIVDIYIPRGSM
jgi:hypothetical protein